MYASSLQIYLESSWTHVKSSSIMFLGKTFPWSPSISWEVSLGGSSSLASKFTNNHYNIIVKKWRILHIIPLTPEQSKPKKGQAWNSVTIDNKGFSLIIVEKLWIPLTNNNKQLKKGKFWIMLTITKRRRKIT